MVLLGGGYGVEAGTIGAPRKRELVGTRFKNVVRMCRR